MAWFKDKGPKKLKNALFLVFLGGVRTMQEKKTFWVVLCFLEKIMFRENEMKGFFFASSLWYFFFLFLSDEFIGNKWTLKYRNERSFVCYRIPNESISFSALKCINYTLTTLTLD